MRAVSMGNLAVVLAALAFLSQPGHAQLRLTKSPSVTLQVVALEPSQLADGVLQLAPGGGAELELRAVDASGEVMDLSSTAIQWQASDPNVLQVKGDGPRAMAGRVTSGEATLTVSALGQQVALSAPVVAASPPAAAPAVPSQPVAPTAQLVPNRALARSDLAIPDLCARGIPDPAWGQPCIREVRPTTARYGTMVFVKGTGFRNASAMFGGVNATWITDDTLAYATVVPGMVDGNIVVTDKSSGRRSTASFTLDRTPPRLLPLDPDSGVACSQATIRGIGLLPPMQVGAVPVTEIGGGDTVITFRVPRLPPGVSSGFIRVGPGLGLVSTTPFRVLAPAPTASLPPPDPSGGPSTSTIWAGSTRLSFVGHLREVTKVTFAGGVELNQGWTVLPAPPGTPQYHRDPCLDRLEILVPAAAVSGPVTFTNPRGSVSVNLTISH